MIVLELDETDAEMLRRILETYLGDLRMEIAGTDLMDFREALKKEEVLLKDLVSRLPAPQP